MVGLVELEDAAAMALGPGGKGPSFSLLDEVKHDLNMGGA